MVDVGGGSSVLVDRLLDAGFKHPTVVDLSETALQRSRDRLGDRAGSVRWIRGDVTELEDTNEFDVWHDRAVFHFLTSPQDREGYVARLRRALVAGGCAVIATFGPEGPTHCSGLPVSRYDADALHRELGEEFSLEHSELVHHMTPAGKSQQFVYTLFRRL